jgi:hypothetical protein
MSIFSKFIDTGRISVLHVVEWRREISARNGTDDARRATANRLRVQLASIGPWIGGYSSGKMPPTYGSGPRRERLEADDTPRL